MCLLDCESAHREQAVYVKDVSLGGLGVLLDHKIPTDALVRVLVAGMSLMGKVVYCRSEEDAFAVGISMLGNTDGVRKLLTAYRPPP